MTLKRRSLLLLASAALVSSRAYGQACFGAPILNATNPVVPSTGPTTGGTTVTISGSNFALARTVTFAGVTASNVVVVSNSTITCTTPLVSAGTTGASVIVTTSNNASNAANTAFVYTTATAGLFGLNISGAEFNPVNGQTFPLASDWTYLGSKNIPFVRLPIAWESIQTAFNGSLNATYLAGLKSAIASATAQNIGVIVDLHNSGAYVQQAAWLAGTYGYAGNAGNAGANVNTMGDGTLTPAVFANVWGLIASALAGSAIGFDLMNEPLGSSITVNALIPFYQAAINAIRAVDSTTRIYVEGAGWSTASQWTTGLHGGAASSTMLGSLTGTNIATEAHCYFDSAPGTDGSSQYTGNYASYGQTPTGAVQSLTPYVNYCNANNTQGWLGEYGVPNDLTVGYLGGSPGQWFTLFQNLCVYLKANNVLSTFWAYTPIAKFKGTPLALSNPGTGPDDPRITLLDSLNSSNLPVVTAVYPSVGAGNSLVAIVGTGLTGATQVTLGTATSTPVSPYFTVINDTQINAYMPFHSAGSRGVFVTTQNGSSSGSVTFTHGPTEIASISPSADLPNPYVFGVTGGGTAVTTQAQWALKQFELREAYAAYWLGHIPPPSPVTRTGTVNDSTVTTSAGTMRNVQVNLQTGPSGAIKFGMNFYIPLNSGAGPFPVLLGSNWAWSPLAATPGSGFSASLGLVSLNTLVNRGYIIAEMSLDQFSLDDGDTSPPEGIFTLNTASDGQLVNPGPGSTGNGVAPVNPISNQYYEAYPIDRTGGPTVTYPSFVTAGLNTPPTGAGGVTGVDTGVQGAWGWGFMRCIDYLVALGAGTGGITVPVDATKMAVTSISHDGGPPLYAAAFDTRIAAACIAQGLGIYSGSRLCEFEGNMGGSGPPPPTTNDPNNGSGENQVANPPRSVIRYIGSAVTPTGSSTTVFQNYESIPSDNHFLMAMIAPRGFMAVANFIGSGGIDSPRACAQKFLTGRTAWAALGAATVPQCWCSDNVSLVANGHQLSTPQYTQMLNYLDYLFKSTALPADVTSPTGSKSIWCNTQNDFNVKSGVSGSPINGSTLTSNTALGFTWTPPSSLTGGGGGLISAPVALINVGSGNLPSGQGPWFASSGGTPAVSTSVNSAAADGNTLVIVPIVTSGIQGQTIQTVGDSAGNSYTVRNSTVSAGLFECAIAYTVITHAINPGTTFTATTTGGASWGIEGAWAIRGAVGGLDQVASSFSTSTTTTATLSLTTTQPNEIVIGFNYTHASGNNTNIYSPETNGFTSLWNDDIVDINYKIVTATGAVPWSVSWSPAYTYSSLLISFIS